MLTFPEASSPQWSLINSLWTFRAWCWPLAPTSLHAVSPWIFSFGQQAPGYQSILTVIWAVNYLQTAGAQKAHLKLKGFHTGLNLPHYNYDMLIKVISVSASSISDVRKQVGGIRDGRHHALSPQMKQGQIRKAAHHLVLTKPHSQEGPGCLPLPLHHRSLLFLWRCHENIRVISKDQIIMLHITQACPMKSTLIQRWFPQMVPEHSMQNSWTQIQQSDICLIHCHS